MLFRKVLAQSEMLVLKDRELKETRNLYGAVKDMLALQPSPEIQVPNHTTYNPIHIDTYISLALYPRKGSSYD
jgi:hypothetical protein